MSPCDAMRAYVGLVEGKGGAAGGSGALIPSTEQERRGEEGEEEEEGAAVVAAAVAGDDGGSTSTSAQSQQRQQQRPLSAPQPSPPPTRFTHRAPARPFGDLVEGASASAPWALHPRKRLDLTFANLLFAAAAAAGSGVPLLALRSGDGLAWVEGEGGVDVLPPLLPPSLGGGAGGRGWVLPCLSVRTGWDLLLQALALPPGSQVRKGPYWFINGCIVIALVNPGPALIR